MTNQHLDMSTCWSACYKDQLSLAIHQCVGTMNTS